MLKVKYSPANRKLSKLKKKTYSLDLLSGYACPYAKDCKSMVVEKNRDNNGRFTKKYLRIRDGKDITFRCFSASIECRLPVVYYHHKTNYQAIKNTHGVNNILSLLEQGLPKDAQIVRFHVSGDFFKDEYFRACIKLAQKYPYIRFYAYTKAIPLWIKYISIIPNNFILTASYGGTHDCLIEEYGLKSTRVVLSKSEAKKFGLSIAQNENNAVYSTKSFALIIHSSQPKNSPASKAWQKIKRSKKVNNNV